VTQKKTAFRIQKIGFATNYDTMHGLTSGLAAMRGLVRSAIMLSACILAAALILMPFAAMQRGSNGPLGLAAAAGICLFSGLMAEIVVQFMSRTSPLSGPILGMMVRMFAPLGVCLAILAAGQNGRDQVYFIGYLLTFYMVVLGLETWFAVKRSSGPPSNSNRSVR
jgi:hypothetical protein